MGKNKFTRVLALCLAVVCLVSVASALSFDLSGDGKTDVWDLQLAVNDGKTENYADALTEALGGKDELHPNAEGVYEIWSALGLYNMAKMINEGTEGGKTFKLMRNIDMGGAAWATTETFAGTFEGNGYSICNLVINDDYTFTKVNADTGVTTYTHTMGFFAKIGTNGVVRNVHLENVTLRIPEDSKATFVGLLAGSCTGVVENCTSVGTVIDPRTKLDSKCYIGTLLGRIENVSYASPISITDESILMTAETPEVTAISGKSQKVLCKMALELAELEEGSEQRQLGIAGWAPGTPGKDTSKWPEQYNWQDISGATSVVGRSGNTYYLEDPILTARRQAAVDKMYEICTVQWTPSQDLTLVYYKVGTGENAGKLAFSRRTWKAGTTYYGMPYNHGSGSLERFEAWMQEGTDSKGRLVTKIELPTHSFYYTHSGVRSAMNTDGANATYQDPNYSFGRETTRELLNQGWLKSAEGNYLLGYSNATYDLSHGYNSDLVGDAVIYQKVDSADHAGFSRYIGNDCSQAIQWAWREVVSNDVKTGGTVISGVTQMCPTTDYQTRFGVLPVGGIVPSAYSVAAIDQMYNKETFMNAYAQASKGDGLIVDQTAGGHSRMLAYDPICIRNYKGVIHEENSYVISHEQGGSSKDGYNTTCNWNRVVTFKGLLDDNDHVNNNADGKGVNCAHYFPMTLPAFHNTDDAAVTSYVTYENGVVKSNFFILSTAVEGNEVFTAIGQNNGVNSTATDKKETIVGPGYREAQLSVKLADAHGEVPGTVTVRLSNGDLYTVNTATGAVTKAN